MTKFEKYASELTNGEAVYITSPVTRRYATDFESSDGIVFATNKGITLFLDMRYFEMAKVAKKRGAIPGGIDVREIGESAEFIKKAIADGAKKVKFEDRRTTCAGLEALKKRYEGAEFAPLGDEIEKLRWIKTPKELQRIKNAQAVTTAAFAHILDFIRPGLTEADVALELEFYMRKNGAECAAFETICVSGKKTSMPHGRPENVKLTPNSFITMDFGAKFEGYCSDMTRTVCLGQADERQRLVYETVLKAQETAVAFVKAGLTGKEIDASARDVIDKAGFGKYFTHSLGHSVGIEIHESPNFSPKAEDIIPEGAVVTVEPGIYIEGEFGVRIEDMVSVTKTGCEDLTPVDKKLLEIF
ncbi:MAG: aminopeptidase P family protein [Clostridia bacterium]|nr:aminopeptidase P family protein [Clostridia bacterium]